MHFLQAINSDLSVLIDCNKTGGTIKGDIKKKKRERKLGFLYKVILERHCKGGIAEGSQLKT